MYGPPGYAPPPAWNPPRRPAVNPTVLAVVLTLVLVTVFAAVFLLAFLPVGNFALFLGPFCFIFVVLIVVLVSVAARASRRPSLPPPPPIQQRMVPAGMEGPIAVNCPNCGAPPESIDRFGVAVCTHCGTRFLVR